MGVQQIRYGVRGQRSRGVESCFWLVDLSVIGTALVIRLDYERTGEIANL